MVVKKFIHGRLNRGSWVHNQRLQYIEGVRNTTQAASRDSARWCSARDDHNNHGTCGMKSQGTGANATVGPNPTAHESDARLGGEVC